MTLHALAFLLHLDLGDCHTLVKGVDQVVACFVVRLVDGDCVDLTEREA